MSGHNDAGNAMSAGPGDETLDMQIADALRQWFEDDAEDAAREVRQILAPVIERRVWATFERVRTLADECAEHPDRLIPSWAMAGDIRRALFKAPMRSQIICLQCDKPATNGGWCEDHA